MIKSFLFLISLLFLSQNLSSQVIDVFEVKTQDALQFEEGRFIKIPANRTEFQHDYLIELDSVYTVVKITLDQTVAGVEFYGYHSWEAQHGQFNLMFISNADDQVYQLNHQVRYIMIRSSGELWTPLNLDLEVK